MVSVRWEEISRAYPAVAQVVDRDRLASLWITNPAAAGYLAMHLEDLSRQVGDARLCAAVADAILTHAPVHPEAVFTLTSPLTFFAKEIRREPEWTAALAAAVRQLPFSYVQERASVLADEAARFVSPESFAAFAQLLQRYPAARPHDRALAALMRFDPELAAAAAARAASPHLDLWRVWYVAHRTGERSVALALLGALADEAILALRSLGPGLGRYATERLTYLALGRPEPEAIRAFAASLGEPRFVRLLAARPHEGVAAAEAWCARLLRGEGVPAFEAHVRRCLASVDLSGRFGRQEIQATWPPDART